jgi:hypothetical protein
MADRFQRSWYSADSEWGPVRHVVEKAMKAAVERLPGAPLLERRLQS